MLFLLSTSAFALTCDASDTACNAANQIRDLVNSVQPGAMDDNFSGKRGTNFVRSKIETLEVIFTDAGCTLGGIDAVSSSNGSFIGVYQNVDTTSGTITGSFDAFNNVSATYTGDEAGSIGDWGVYDLHRGTMASLRGGNFGVLAGGVARINGRRAVGWGLHGVCPDADLNALLSSYVPAIERFEAQCDFDVTAAAEGPAPAGDCDCIEAVCAADEFCCDTSWDEICAGEAADTATFPQCSSI